jgi:hypothetical protein
MIRNITRSMAADSVPESAVDCGPVKSAPKIESLSAVFARASLHFGGPASKLFLLLMRKGLTLGC